MTITRFIRRVWALKRLGLLTRRTVHAAWLHSRDAADWVEAFDDLTDTEFCDYTDAVWK